MALFQLNRGLIFRFLWQGNLIDLLWFRETFSKPARPFEKVSIAVGRRQNLLIWHIVGLPVDYINPATAHLFKMADALTPKTSLAIRQAPICSQTCSQSTPTTRLVGVLLWLPWRWSCLKTLGWRWLLPRGSWLLPWGRLWPRGAPGRPLGLPRAGLPGRWRVLAWAACTPVRCWRWAARRWTRSKRHLFPLRLMLYLIDRGLKAVKVRVKSLKHSCYWILIVRFADNNRAFQQGSHGIRLSHCQMGFNCGPCTMDTNSNNLCLGNIYSACL